MCENAGLPQGLPLLSCVTVEDRFSLGVAPGSGHMLRGAPEEVAVKSRSKVHTSALPFSTATGTASLQRFGSTSGGGTLGMPRHVQGNVL